MVPEGHAVTEWQIVPQAEDYQRQTDTVLFMP
jgi:hypothetical protein